MDASLTRPIPTPAVAQSSLPPGWEVAHDEASGLPYYFNLEKNISSWLPPTSGVANAASRPQVAITSAARREAAVRSAGERRKEREAQQADWKAREEALKKLRAKTHARVTGDDDAAVSKTRGGTAEMNPTPSSSMAVSGQRSAYPAEQAPKVVPINERRSWLASQPKTVAVSRGAENVANYMACLSKELERPVEPVSSFYFDESTALAKLQYRAQKEALAAAGAGAATDDWQAAATARAPSNLSEEELKIWYAFVAADTDGSGTVSKKELFRAFEKIGLKGTAKERAQLYQFADADRSGEIEWPEFLKLGRKFCQLKELPPKTGRVTKEEFVRDRAHRSAITIQTAHRGKLARKEMDAMRSTQQAALAKRQQAADDVRRRAFTVYSGGSGRSIPPAVHTSFDAHPTSSIHTQIAPRAGIVGPQRYNYPQKRPSHFVDSRGSTGSFMHPAQALVPAGEAARRAAAATAIQRSARGSAARRHVKQRASIKERESKYREAAAKREQSRRILSLASALIEHGTGVGAGNSAPTKGGARKGTGAAPVTKRRPKEQEGALGKAMSEAGITSSKKGKRAGKPGASVEPTLANKVAIHRAFLATAFAAECRPRSESVPLRALGRIMRRAQVPGACTLPAASEELANVQLTFDEVAEIASKLRARSAASGGLLAGDGGVISSGVVDRAPEAGQLTVESRVALARAFAAADDDARGSVATSRLPKAFASAGVFASPQALHLLLGTALSDRKRVEWRDFMRIATTLVALQPAGFEMLQQPGNDGEGEMLLSVHELQLLEPPTHTSVYLTATIEGDGSEERPEPVRTATVALSSARTSIGLQMIVSPRYPIRFSIVGLPVRKARSIVDPAPVEMFRTELITETLSQAYQDVMRTGSASQLVLPLYDKQVKRGALVVSITDATSDPAAVLSGAPRVPLVAADMPLPMGGYNDYADNDRTSYGASRGGARSTYAPPPPGLSHFETRLWRSFVAADADGSGRLSKRELTKALAAVGLRGTRGDELAVFKKMDKDSSGTVEWPEYRQIGLKLKQLANVADSVGGTDSASGDNGYRQLASGGSRHRPAQPPDEDLSRAVTTIQAAGRGSISRKNSRKLKKQQQLAAWGAPHVSIEARCAMASVGMQRQVPSQTMPGATYKLLPPSGTNYH